MSAFNSYSFSILTGSSHPGFITYIFSFGSPISIPNFLVKFELAIINFVFLKEFITLLFNDEPKGWLISLECIKQKVGIFGDYDVDGASATALLANYFNKKT